jgi:hypothetical protein
VNAANGQMTLRIIIDRTSMEVFANDGQVSMNSCFPPGPEQAALELCCAGGSPRIRSMAVYELNSTWPTRRVGNAKRGKRNIIGSSIQCLYLYAIWSIPIRKHTQRIFGHSRCACLPQADH